MFFHPYMNEDGRDVYLYVVSDCLWGVGLCLIFLFRTYSNF